MANELAMLPAEDWSREKIELIKRTIASGTTDDELQLFLYTSKRTGLDPLAKQIYAVKRWNAQSGREVMTVQTGIDGYRLIADRTAKLAGISDPSFDDESKEFPGKATVTVKKLLEGGVIADFTATARWSEYVQTGKDKKTGAQYVTAMWKKMPFLMLGKCAEALALRKAFPADLSGVYTSEEMAQADNDATPAVVISAQPADPKFATTADVDFLWDKCRESGKTKDDVQAEFKRLGVKTVHTITPDTYNALLTWASSVGDAFEPQTVVAGEAA